MLGKETIDTYSTSENRGRDSYDRELLTQIYECLRENAENEENYGVWRIITWLRLYRGNTSGDRRIYRICQKHYLTICPKRSPNGITKADQQAEKSENLIKRDYTAEKRIKSFLTDITEIPCADVKLYLTAILDCFDGSIQGFAMAHPMQAKLCESAEECLSQQFSSRFDPAL